MRLLVQHRSLYRYGAPAALGPHTVRLRPATHARAAIESYSLTIAPEHQLRWQQDPYGNHIARITFRSGTRVAALDVLVELAVDVRPVNPFDFFLDDRCEQVPFTYPPELVADLSPFLERPPATPRLEAFLAEQPAGGATVPFVIALNQAVNRRIAYVIREESGIWTPEETLAAGRGSCRDSAALLVAAMRSRGLAARFASGYLVQLTDEGMIPDQPRGVGRDVVDLHAWAEVYLPGGGWIGLDATSGLLTGEGHIPLCCTAQPAAASPIEGTSDSPATAVEFEMRLGRIGHEPRPTAPYTEEVWDALLAAGDRVDAALEGEDLALTSGGEPTFNSREHAELPEWNNEALGETKWSQGLRLAAELRARLLPGGALIRRQGKWYPGESLPRWVLEVVGRRSGQQLWRDEAFPDARADATLLARTLATRLELAGSLIPAFEDPWRHLQQEAQLPVDVDPLARDLDDPEERRRLARVLDRGLGREAGWVLPLARATSGRWRSEVWSFRRERLYLIPGDSPIGLRLPLASLPPVPPEPEPEADDPPDPRRAKAVAPVPRDERPIRTALCVEERNGQLFLFLPPIDTAADWFALVELCDAIRCELETDVLLEGYGPPSEPEVVRIGVAPDPGVLEVNLPPSRTSREHADLVATVFDAALHAGLHSEKYLIDGRQAGSGGGHHLTLGGPTATESPFVRRPDLLASLITFCQHHPSLSYLFTGLFVGPTSQAPRADEARHDALYELEIAMRRAFERSDEPPPPWLADMLFRHLLVDVTGNTHRAEISIDKLHDWRTEHGRQGLVELRAFEMPPHPRMAAAQMMLVRALSAAFAAEPYDRPMVRWGQALSDRFLLPHHLWRDFEDVLGYLESCGLPLPQGAYRPFLELRCPVVGHMQAGDVALEVRNALEPWHVLGEEPSGGGTSRFVDASMERVEVRVDGLVAERHQVLVNGLELPMRPTDTAGEAVGGVRFRAWAPAHSLHAHIGIHHPLRFDVLDRWARRSLGACAYHVWHPEGRAFLSPPLTRFEASARRAQRFTLEGPSPWPVSVTPASPHPDAPCTLDLRRFPGDRPMPDPDPDPDPDSGDHSS
ncbi:MAG TPA: transglutaminase family protein [Kofleriaceae bacterium]